MTFGCPGIDFGKVGNYVICSCPFFVLIELMPVFRLYPFIGSWPMPPLAMMCTISSYLLCSKADMPLHVYVDKKIPAHPSKSGAPP